MSYKNYGRKNNWNNRNTGSKKQNHAKEVTKLAYLLGCVERGRKNPDSRISASYEQGKNYAEKQKKSLY